MNPKEQLIENLQGTLQTLQERMKENEAILEQNRLEVDRVRQKNVSISAQLKNVKDHFDSLPRQDIRVAYEDAMDARTRLAEMNGQLERLESTQKYLDEFKETVRDIIDVLGGIEVSGQLTAGGETGAASAPAFQLSLAGEQIVKIVEAQESERKRLADALHDGPAQSLTNFILQAEICQRLFERNPDKASTELGNLKTSASTAFQKIRTFIFDLRPMMLDDLGLIDTLKRHAENLNDPENFEVKFHMTGSKRRLPSHVEVIMFRGIQLLVNNARDILQAKKVDIKLDIGDSQVAKGVVEDNGRGFDKETVLDRSLGDSPLQNLLDLKERIEIVGGTLEIFSAEGESSTIEITLPFSDEL